MSRKSFWLSAALFSLCFFALTACGAGKATLALGSSLTPKVGDTFQVPVLLDSAATIDSVDLVLHFDPKFLSLVEIENGEIFETYPVSEGNKNGEIRISAASTKDFFSGQGAIATLNFKATAAGTSSVTFDFEPSSTLDCDVMSQTADVLEQVTNLDLDIQA